MGLVRWCRGVGDESDGYNAPPSFRKAVGVTLAPFTANSTPAPGPARRMHGTLSARPGQENRRFLSRANYSSVSYDS